MNKLSPLQRAQVVASLVEGNSIRSTVRMTGVAKNTVAKLLFDLGGACSALQVRTLRNLTCKRIRCDEIWTFAGVTARNTAETTAEGRSDVWTWTAFDEETKLIPCWRVGPRDAGSAFLFIRELAGRLSHRAKLTPDGAKLYLIAVDDGVGDDLDFTLLVKIYGEGRKAEARYSSAEDNETKVTIVAGDSDYSHVSTSSIDRSDLSIDIGNRRFTSPTNALSNKLENHEHALALHFTYHNFCRVQQTLRVTPAMEAGIADHVWSIADLVALLDSPPEGGDCPAAIHE